MCFLKYPYLTYKKISVSHICVTIKHQAHQAYIKLTSSYKGTVLAKLNYNLGLLA